MVYRKLIEKYEQIVNYSHILRIIGNFIQKISEKLNISPYKV